MSGGLDSFPSRTRLAELYRERTGQELVLDGSVPIATNDRQKPEPARNATAITWPVRLTLPWSTLISDNDKFRAMLRGDQAIMVIKRPYREAGERIHQLATSKLGGAQLAAEPLQAIARVWFPDNNVRDMTNWSKLVFDSLEGAVYENDRWLHRVIWERAGVDVDAPRAELTITPWLP
jgi:hypothetical protein